MIYKSFVIENNVELIKENICLFYGENLGLKNDLKSKFVDHYKNVEILRYFQDELLKNNNILINEIQNVSLFEKNKIFIIENVNDKILELIEEIENIDSDRKVLLFADTLEKKSKLRNYIEKSKKSACVPCYEDNELSIKKIISLKLNGFSGLSGYNMNLILEHTNLDRSKVNNEIEKIITYFTEKKIETEELKELLNVKSNNDFNKIKDEALLGNKINTNKLLSDTFFETEKSVFYINMINQRLDKLLEINKLNHLKPENAVNEIKPPVFWKDKPNLIGQAKKWDQNKIKELLNITYDIEKKLKNNVHIEKGILIKKLMIDICSLANV